MNLFAYVHQSPLKYTDPTGNGCLADYEACKRQARADWRACKKRCGRMCGPWLIFDLGFCRATYEACIAREIVSHPVVIVGGACVVVGATVMCADTPVPGPADVVGVPIVVGGMAIIGGSGAQF